MVQCICLQADFSFHQNVLTQNLRGDRGFVSAQSKARSGYSLSTRMKVIKPEICNHRYTIHNAAVRSFTDLKVIMYPNTPLARNRNRLIQDERLKTWPIGDHLIYPPPYELRSFTLSFHGIGRHPISCASPIWSWLAPGVGRRATSKSVWSDFGERCWHSQSNRWQQQPSSHQLCSAWMYAPS